METKVTQLQYSGPHGWIMIEWLDGCGPRNKYVLSAEYLYFRLVTSGVLGDMSGGIERGRRGPGAPRSGGAEVRGRCYVVYGNTEGDFSQMNTSKFQARQLVVIDVAATCVLWLIGHLQLCAVHRSWPRKEVDL